MKRPAKFTPNRGKRPKLTQTHLPVSTLCGFLGAGKTTLLKHILESKHKEDEAFRCAVIVNDMAELNIDKSLIDQSAVVQSDDVIAMQNGCVCCTLQNDLINQIRDLAKKKIFDYMIIEASGVSEPAQIAKVFADCEEDHDHEKEHGTEEQVSKFATLDTCVTVVDSADFFNNLQNVIGGPKHESFPHLLVEQIEYANVIILNKTDLVNQAQLDKVSAQVSILNPRACIVNARNSKIDVMQVVGTGLYKAEDFATFHQQIVEEKEDSLEKPCCKESVARGEPPCCRSKRTHDSGKSKIITAGPKQVSKNVGQDGIVRHARHSSRFGITSFLYQARRPFHPERFDVLVKKFFVLTQEDDEEEEENAPTKGDVSKKKPSAAIKDQKKKLEEKKRKEMERKIKQRQKEACAKQALRKETMGELYRSKGFVWLGNRHDYFGTFQTAWDVLRIEFPSRWFVLEEKAWLGTEEEKAALRKNWVEPWGDRRQELVFIGKDLKHEEIQKLFDDCLLTDDEMSMGVDGWKATFGDVLMDTAVDDGSDEDSE